MQGHYSIHVFRAVMANVNIHGNNIYYTDQGEGEPLLLVHGTGFNADIWHKVFEPLARHHRVIAYDRRAYGRSVAEPPDRGEYYRQHADDAAALLELFDAVPATVLGWSAGAIVALHLALHHPGCVGRLILYDPSLHLSRDPDFESLPMFMRFAAMRALGRRKQAARVFAKMVLRYRDGRNSFDMFDPEFMENLNLDADALLAEVAAGTGEELVSETIGAGIGVPVTLIQGEQSPRSLERAIGRLSSILPTASVVRMPDVAHLAHVDRPDEFVRVVLETGSRFQ